ncbi:MAG TPA: SGNH/GDSL hydrolase family protein [Candidatus Binatia bacterium]|nr:SGNH/GDSL hydrolase family protein [Candidatus Binatia bacterium]
MIRKTFLAAIVALFFSVPAFSQNQITTGRVTPTGSCAASANPMYVNLATGTGYLCQNGLYVPILPSMVLTNSFADYFNRAALGSNWNQAIGTWTTSASGPVTTGSGFSVAQFTQAGAADTEDVRAIVPGAAITLGYAGVWARSTCVSGTCSAYGFVENDMTLYLAKWVGTTSSSGGTVTVYNGSGSGTTITANAYDELELKVTGGKNGTAAQLQAYWNRTALTFEVADSSSPLTGGFPGLITSTTNSVYSFIYNAPAPSTAARNIVVAGDSTCEGAGIYTRWSNFLLTPFKNAYVTNVCVSTQGLGTVFSAATSGNLNTGLQDGVNVVDPLIVPGAINIAVLLEGTNDLGPGTKTPATVQGYEATWVANRHSAGYKYAVVVPVLSRCDTASYDPTVALYDILVNQNAAHADAIVGLTQALVGRGACLTSVFNTDHVHPSEYAASELLGRPTGTTITGLP